LSLKRFSSSSSSGPTVPIQWVLADGSSKTVQAQVGRTLLEAAHDHDIPLEGACEGSLACSTCHVILQDKVYSSLEEASDAENDMLDMAYGLTCTSRLGCQIHVTEHMSGAVVTLPKATRNFAVVSWSRGHGI
jgi:ferredoxin